MQRGKSQSRKKKTGIEGDKGKLSLYRGGKSLSLGGEIDPNREKTDEDEYRRGGEETQRKIKHPFHKDSIYPEGGLQQDERSAFLGKGLRTPAASLMKASSLPETTDIAVRKRARVPRKEKRLGGGPPQRGRRAKKSLSLPHLRGGKSERKNGEREPPENAPKGRNALRI